MKILKPLIALTILTTTPTQAKPPEITVSVNNVINRHIAKKELTGAVTMAIHKGKIIHFSALGMANKEKNIPMQKNTLFRIASLTKNYSALLIKILEEQGKLSIHDKVSKYLPEFKNIKLKLDDNHGEIDLRIWHLMSHTSGVDIPPAYHKSPNLKTAASSIADQPLHFRPGTQWKYSKGMDVCGRIIEIVSGKPFDQFLKEQITTPLSLTDTAYYVPDEQAHRIAVVYMPNKEKTDIIPGNHPSYITAPKKGSKPNPSSGLISSTQDVATYYTMLLNKGVHNGKRIVSEQSVQELVKNWTGNLKTNGAPNTPSTGISWGLGFGIVYTPTGVTSMLSPGTYGHGGAYGNQAWVDPTTQTIYILMIQRKGFGNGDFCNLRKEFQQAISDHLPE